MPWRPTLPTRTAWHLVPDLPANHPHRPRQASSAALPAGVLPPGTRRRTWNSPLCQPVDPLHTGIAKKRISLSPTLRGKSKDGSYHNHHTNTLPTLNLSVSVCNDLTNLARWCMLALHIALDSPTFDKPYLRAPISVLLVDHDSSTLDLVEKSLIS